MKKREKYLKAKENFFIEKDDYNILEEKTWKEEMLALKGKNVYKDGVDTVYLYSFPKENAVYIGRTLYPNLRDKQHRVRESDSVYKFADNTNSDIPKMEILESGLNVIQGAEREKFWANFYKNNGVKLINKQPCGSLGYMTKGKWTKEKCFEEAKKYTKRSDFQKNASQAYTIAMNNGWLDEMTWLPNKEKKASGYWKNKDNIIAEAKKYTSTKEFIEKNPSAYFKACLYGYIDDLTWLEKENRLPFGFWKDKEHVLEEAKKYRSKKEFQENNQSAYWAALKYGYLDEMPWLHKNKVTKRGRLTNEEYIMSESKKYKTRKEFMENNKSAYSAAQRYGLLNKMDWLPKKTTKPKGYWNDKETVFEESKKYSTLAEFYKKSNGAYSSAKKHDWLDEMTWLDKNENKK